MFHIITMYFSIFTVFVVCRRGNDSQIAVAHLKGKMDNSIEAKDIIGGLHAWHYQCDKMFPIY